MRTETRGDTLALVGLGLAALVLGLGVAWLLAGFLTRPLRGLTAAARRVGAGDLAARADERGAREHRDVAHAFNDMTDRLGRSLVAQREFVANAAHQLRTPLTGLRLRLESAGLKTEDPALRRDLAAAEREADRLARTVTDLLTLAREGQPPADVAPLALADAARAALERWEAVAAERPCELRLDAAAEPRARISAEDVGGDPRQPRRERRGAHRPGHDRHRGRRRRRAGGPASPWTTRGPDPRRARRSRPSSASSGAARARGGRAGAASA